MEYASLVQSLHTCGEKKRNLKTHQSGIKENQKEKLSLQEIKKSDQYLVREETL